MSSLLAAAVLLGNTPTVVLFGLMSFWALREFITVTPTRLSDHRALFLIFFVFTPLQYVLVGLNNYDLFSVMIPVYAFLLVPAPPWPLPATISDFWSERRRFKPG